MKVYIRFGDIPKDFQSKVHRSGAIIRNEGGVSVWNCIQADEDEYYPILPDNPNPHAITDYFKMLFSDKPIYLVTGTEMFLTGADGEPLLMDDVTIIKKLDYSWLRGVKKEIVQTEIIDKIKIRCNCDSVIKSEERPQGEWIPVSEKLPEKEGWYLVFLENEQMTVAHSDGIIANHDFEPKMLAWQPLPEPYKKPVRNE